MTLTLQPPHPVPHQPFHVAADETRIARIRKLALAGRTLAAQKAMLRTMQLWRDGSPAAMREITVWWCNECGYWRKEKTSGVHQTPDGEDWRGRMVLHELRPVVFVAKDNLVGTHE